MLLSALFSLIFTNFLIPIHAWSWSGYTHEQVNAAALELLSTTRHPAAASLQNYSKLLSQLGATPDEEWQGIDSGHMPKIKPVKSGKSKKPALTLPKLSVDFIRQENSLHYFNADAFANVSLDVSAFIRLPTNYAQLFNGHNAETIGTAPWRILQLYDLAVSALKAGETKKAILYMGTLGNYVADMAQPFHTTHNRDGENYAVTATGIHQAFDEKVLAGSKLDALIRAAIDALGGQGLDGLSRERLIPQVFKLITQGYPYIEPLLKNFAHQGAKLATQEGRQLASIELSDQVIEGFSQSLVERWTVKQIAESRLVEASILLSKVWASIYEAAGRPVIPNQDIRFENVGVIENYPVFKPSP